MHTKSIVTAAIFACLAAPALAAPVLDQSYIDSSSSGAYSIDLDTSGLGQTFTVGLTGQLTSVGVALTDLGSTGTPFALKIATVSAGLPTATILGSVTLSHSTVPDSDPLSGYSLANLFNVDLSALDLQVTAGEQLAILVENNGAIAWGASSGAGTYSGGDAVITFPDYETVTNAFGTGRPVDFQFATYVDQASTGTGTGTGNTTGVPEPWSLALFGAGLAGLAWRRRSRRG
jgi:PEP-CTERM motif